MFSPSIQFVSVWIGLRHYGFTAYWHYAITALLHGSVANVEVLELGLSTYAGRPQDVVPRHRVIDQQEDPENLEQVRKFVPAAAVVDDVSTTRRFVVVGPESAILNVDVKKLGLENG